METETTPAAAGGSDLRPEATKTEPFVIDSRERVDWYLRKLANLEAEESRIKAQAALMLRQIESDRKSLVQHFQPQVENFVRSELEATRAKRKSIAFFHGTVGFRTVPKKLVIESEADAQTTARAVFPAAFQKVETEKFDKWAFLGFAGERLEEHGELLPGVKLTEAREELSVKFPKEKGAGDAGEPTEGE